MGDRELIMVASLDVVDGGWVRLCVPCVLGLVVSVVLVWLCVSIMCGHGVVVLFWWVCFGRIYIMGLFGCFASIVFIFESALCLFMRLCPVPSFCF